MDGSLSEDRAVWKTEPQRHCKEVYVDVEESAEKQKERIMQFRADRFWHCADDGRIADITVDLVLRARARMAEEKVHGPETQL